MVCRDDPLWPSPTANPTPTATPGGICGLRQAGHAQHGAQRPPKPGSLRSDGGGLEHFPWSSRLAGETQNAAVSSPSTPAHGSEALPFLELAVTGLPEAEPQQDIWHQHLEVWLFALQPHLPPPLGAEAYTVGLTFCDDAEIGDLNRQWRGQEGPTDVLAFAIQEAPIPLPPPLAAREDGPTEAAPLELGDIVISLEPAGRQAEAEGHSLSRELLFLASHGLLHLLGWDHPDDPSLAAMLARQEELLAATAHLPAVTADSCVGDFTG